MGLIVKWGEIISEGSLFIFIFFLSRLSVHGIKPPNNESCFPQFTPRIFQFEQLNENKLPKKFFILSLPVEKEIMINNYLLKKIVVCWFDPMSSL